MLSRQTVFKYCTKTQRSQRVIKKNRLYKAFYVASDGKVKRANFTKKELEGVPVLLPIDRTDCQIFTKARKNKKAGVYEHAIDWAGRYNNGDGYHDDFGLKCWGLLDLEEDEKTAGNKESDGEISDDEETDDDKETEKKTPIKKKAKGKKRKRTDSETDKDEKKSAKPIAPIAPAAISPDAAVIVPPVTDTKPVPLCSEIELLVFAPCRRLVNEYAQRLEMSLEIDNIETLDEMKEYWTGDRSHTNMFDDLRFDHDLR